MKTLLMQKADRRWLLGLAIIAATALLCRIALWDVLIEAWTEQGVPSSDARAIDMWALNILDGLGYRDIGGFWLYEAFRMPLLSVVLAAIYALFGYAYFPARLILMALSVGTCLSLAGVGRLLFNRKTGFLAGLLFAVYYPMLEYALAFMTETLFTFLLVTGLYLLLRGIHERGRGFVLASGITLGLAALTRFVAVVTLPFMALYGLSQPESWTRKIRLGLLCAAAIVITFSPWPIRNALLFHAFFPSESGGTRQMWTAANPAFSGLHYTRNARRLILWADPEASEIERNQRLQQETRAFIRANPAWYLDRMLWRASHYLTLTRWQDAIQQEDWRQRWHHVITWIAAWFGTLGCVLACFKRPRSGLLISSIFLILVGLHSLAGELIRYRLTSEWIWGLGLAYLLAWFSQAARHSMFAMDNTSERPLHASIYDFRWARWGIPVLLLVPFLVLAVRIPIHQARLRHETLPELPKPAAELIAEAGLTEPFVQQDTQLYDVAYYIHHAKQQTAPDITYPRHVIVFRGEMSHFIFRPDGRVRSFSFKVNKAGLHIGDLVTLCRVDEAFHLFLPVPLQRTPGLIVGMISGTGGGAGEPRFAVMDMYVYQDDRWIPCQTPDQAEP